MRALLIDFDDVEEIDIEQAEAVKRDFGENAPMGPYSGLGALEMLRFTSMISRM